MADESTTGSAVVGGITGGLQKGLLSSANNAAEYTEKILIVYGNPNDTVPVYIGSQVAMDIQNNDVYIGDAIDTRIWNRLGSLT